MNLHIMKYCRIMQHSIKFTGMKRYLSSSFIYNAPRKPSKPLIDATISTKTSTSPAIANKYELLDEKSAKVIVDTSEEQFEIATEVGMSDEFEGISLKRGHSGVFDIHELVDLLGQENAKNIFVATVPTENNYVDYICVVSGKSRRHILALAEYVRKVFKRRRYMTDIIPKIEGKSTEDWMALDLGNIALHIFTEKAREFYDLETLWAVGPTYDMKSQPEANDDNVVELLKNYSTFLTDLKPAR